MRFLPSFCAALLLLCLLPTATPTFAEDEAPAPKGPSEEERARIKQLVDELRETTATIRGLAWKRPVEADLLTREQMMVKMKESVKEQLDPEELERITNILRRLGMLGPEEDPLKIALDMITSMAGGFFDPDEKKLYMLAGQDPDSQKPTIIHELLHALEDQYVDLKKRQEALKDNSDGMFAFKCLIEGSAEKARLIYEDQNPDAARMQMAGQSQNQELIEGQRRTFAKTPAFMMLDTLLHYKTGPNFVMKALDGPYAEKMGGLYEKGPTTQEQVLHPERWLGEKKDLPQEVVWSAKLSETLGEGWTEMYDMTQGELDLALWLDFYLGPDDGKLSQRDMMAGTYVAADARLASEGWDGGRMVFVQNDKKHIVVASAFVFDTREDADEGYSVMQKTLAKMYGDEWTAGKPQDAEDGSSRFNYVGLYGPGRLARIGNAVLWLDGLEEDELKRAWPTVAATTFKKAEGDTYVAAEAANLFEGCEIVRPDLGVGWDVPMSWTINERAAEVMGSRDPVFVGMLERTVNGDEGQALGTVRIILRAVNQGLSRGVIPEVIKSQGPPNLAFAEDRLVELDVNGMLGYSYDLLPPEQVQSVQLAIFGNGIRTFIAQIQGTRAAVTALGTDITALLEGIREKLVY